MTGRRAVFLDRDGVINALVPRDGRLVSPRRPAEFRLLPGIAEAAARLRREAWLIFIITNQPDLARGRMDACDHAEMMAAATAATAPDDVAVCPHDDADACQCRKPRPGLVLALASRWSVDLAASWLIGDSWRDVEAGRAAGCRTVLVGPGDRPGLQPDLSAADLPSAVALLHPPHS
ncbi:MAG: HAD-IIIA family hydrolase [Gemmatimonadales bacterium]|nr:HAD-IIIA family hydrolase [Gemmatimonadales bacterium]